MKNRARLVFSFLLAVWFCWHASLSAEAAAIPKNGSIAILTSGSSQQHAASAASILTQQLIARGYKVVDPDRLNAIRRGKAAALALAGDVDAIMKLSSQYGFSTMITVAVEAGVPVENEFKLFTGTSSAAVMATGSNGSRLYADTVPGKQVGYTPSEAAQKSLEAAVKLAADKMTQ
jgi:hypothetical protein